MPNLKAKIESPCVKECALDRASGSCAACFRTIEEIVAWKDMSPEDRARVMLELPERAPAEGPEPGW